ncbi:MAG TPA: hypothetical protein HPP77_10820 [Candidatus Hydrogenedentes bacterium]|nr:hypothetical protein [Candidatus Hydrogenedentota bacterium]
MRTRIAFVAAFVSVLCGCLPAHFDFGMDFRIRGDVFDEATREPLEGVKVVFTHTGYVCEPADVQREEEIGESNSAGHIDIQYEYGTGRTVSPLRLFLEPLTFDISLSKEGYREERFALVARAMVRPEARVVNVVGTFNVNLNRVYLEPTTPVDSAKVVARMAGQLLLLRFALP